MGLSANRRISSHATFLWTAQFIGFVPGEKSPYQHMAVEVMSTTDSSSTLPVRQQIQLRRSLRRMMMGYLQPQDWIRVAGKIKVDHETGKTLWQACEVIKVSTQQARTLSPKGNELHRSRQSIARSESINRCMQTDECPTRILMCQKSSCRQRGSQAVKDAIARVLESNGQSAKIQILPTGCMKQCKSGPHLVLISSQQAQQKTKTTRHTHVTPDTATQIIEPLL